MAVDIAKVYIDAEDRSNAAFTSAQRNIQGLVDKVVATRAGIVGLAAAIAGGGLALLIKQTISAQAEMDDLAESTGLTVEKISELRQVSEIAGRPVGELADAIAKFNKNVVEAASNPKGDMARLMKQLGIQVTDTEGRLRSADDLIQETVTAFGEYSDSVTKSAAAQMSFGKSGAKLLPVIKDLNEAGKQNVKTSKEQAAEAERVEKSSRRIFQIYKQQGELLATTVTPSVSALTETLRQYHEEAVKSGSGVQYLIGLGLADWAAAGVIALGTLADALRVTWEAAKLLWEGLVTAGKSIAAFAKVAAAPMQVMSGDLIGGLETIDRFKLEVGEAGQGLNKAMQAFSSSLDTRITERLIENLYGAQLRLIGFSLAGNKATKDMGNWKEKGAELTKAYESLRDEMGKSIAGLDAQIDAWQRTGEAALSTKEAQVEYLTTVGKLKELDPVRKAELITIAKTEDALKRAGSAQQRYWETVKREAEDAKKDHEEYQQFLLDLEIDTGDKLLSETEKIQMQLLEGTQARADAELEIEARKFRDIIALYKEGSLERQALEQKYLDWYAARTKQIAKAVGAEQARAWEDAASRIANVLTDMAFSGKSAFDILKNAARDFLRELIAVFAKRWLLQIGAGMVGGSAGQALAAQAGQVGQGSLAGGVIDWGLGAMGLGEGAMGAFAEGFGSQALVYAPGSAGYYGSMAGANLSGMGFGSAAAGAGIAGIGGGLVGYFGSGLMGAGQRGQQVGGISGASLAMIGGAIGGPMGAAIGAVLGAVIGKFTDPDGLANRTAQFGTNPAGNYAHDDEAGVSYAARSAFGEFGAFGDQWFGHDMTQGMQAFLGMQAELENRYAALLTRNQRMGVSETLAQPREYSFGTEHGDFGAALGEIARDRMSVIVEAVLPGLGQLVEGFEGTVEELFTFVDGLVGMKTALTGIDDTLMQLTGDFAGMVTKQIEAMDTSVSEARDAWDEVKAGDDPAKIFAAEQDLVAAIMNRYQTEVAMVRQIENAIRALDREAYQFALNIAQRINSVGGSRDIGAIAFNRAGALRAGIGSGPIGSQIEDLGEYVGSIDTWYQARRSAIERDIQAQMQANAAIAAAQQAAAEARIQQLQDELAVVNQFQELLDRTRQMIDDMRLSSANPLAVQGRVDLAGGDVAALREEWQSATGADRAAAANRLLDALQRYRELGQEAFQRPSPEWQALYNEIMVDLTAVQEDAKTVAERAVEIQQQILEAQSQAAAYAAATASATMASSAALDALNEEALGYYTWAEEEGQRLYAIQRQQHQEQLDAITGGMEAELFIAARQAETVEELRAIRAVLSDWLAAAGLTAGNPAGGTTQGPDTAGTNPGGTKGAVVLQIQVSPEMSTDQLVAAVRKAATPIKRVLANA